MDQPTPDKPNKPLIQLYPPGPLPGEARPAGRPLPQFVLKDDGQDISDEFLTTPIPESPPHICPICDYNLTGLKRRRCPECGELFELHEARRYGSRKQPKGREDYFIATLNSIALLVGFTLFFGSITAGSMFMPSARGKWAMWFVIVGLLIAMWVYMFRVYFGRNRCFTVLFAGVAMATFVGMMLVLAY